MNNIYFRVLILLALLLTVSIGLQAQDTLRLNLSEFIEMSMDESGQVQYERGAVDLARKDVDLARAKRFLPRIDLSTQHGVIPGVVSQTDLPSGQYYLDPNLENDWEDWAVFTRAELTAIQPIFTWGAVNSAIQAARSAAEATEYEFESQKAEIELQYYELYYSYLLAIEISRILEDADDQLLQIENRLKDMQEEGDPDLKESDIFKLEMFKSDFEVQKLEVEQSLQFVKRVWQRALKNSGSFYRPAEDFLDPVALQIEDYDFYEEKALQARPELKGISSGIDAVSSKIDAVKAQNYPALVLGISGSYANTPNRPRQTNPFIINNTNFASGAVGLSIRQNLNFSSMRRNVEKVQIEHRRVRDLKDAVSDGIILELNENYREAIIAEKKVQQTEESLSTARNWVRHEQLNYDIGFGDAEDLTEAIQAELETRLELKQNVFELNKSVAELYKSAGLQISQLSVN